MLIGYARVSTDLQTTDGQIDALKAAGCERVFQESISGTRADRPQLAAALEYAREGDVLVVARLDRLAQGAGWRLAGGTHLFRLYETPDARQAQAALAQHHVWTRRFPYSDAWLRLGLPGNEGEWQRLEAALGA